MTALWALSLLLKMTFDEAMESFETAQSHLKPTEIKFNLAMLIMPNPSAFLLWLNGKTYKPFK